jgi:hypothetical protein
MEPLKISNINVDNIVYTKIKKKQDYKIILMKYNNENFVFQTNKLLNLNSVNNYEHDLLLSLNKKNSSSTECWLDEFINFINKLEIKIKNDVAENTSWLYNNDFIIFQKLVRDNNCIKIKLINNDTFKTVFKLNNKNINNVSINQNCYCKLILECYGIWINEKNNFGIYLRPVVVSFMNLENVYNYDFISDSDTSNVSSHDLNIIDSFDNDLEKKKIEDCNDLESFNNNINNSNDLDSLDNQDNNLFINKSKDINEILSPSDTSSN